MLATQDVWGGSLVQFQKCSFMGDNFMQLMEYCIERFSFEDSSYGGYLLKNLVTYKSILFLIIFSLPLKLFLRNLWNLLMISAGTIKKDEELVIYGGETSSHILLKEWQPLPAGIIKVNWDASLQVKKCHIGIGIVARDEYGNFLGIRAITKNVVTNPKVAEAMAALEAILFCKQAGFFNVLLEGDAKQVVNKVNHGSINLSTGGHFIEGIIS